MLPMLPTGGKTTTLMPILMMVVCIFAILFLMPTKDD